MQLGFWLWTSGALLGDQGQIDLLVSEARDINATDIYVYVAPQWYTSQAVEVANLNTAIQSSGMRAWALDGDADYIDVDAAVTTFEQSLQDLATFNDQVAPGARFYGYQG